MSADLICRVCGKPIVRQHTTGRPPVTCSDECRMLPCPRCGDPPWVMFDDQDQTHVVGHFCHYVGLLLACDPSKAEAVKKWNEMMERQSQ